METTAATISHTVISKHNIELPEESWVAQHLTADVAHIKPYYIIFHYLNPST